MKMKVIMVQRQAISPSLFYIFFFESYGHSLIRFPFDFLLINSATKGLSKGLSTQQINSLKLSVTEGLERELSMED